MKDITITISAKAIANFIGEYNEFQRVVRAFDAGNDTDDATVYQDALERYLDFFGLAPVFEPENDLEGAWDVLVGIISEEDA